MRVQIVKESTISKLTMPTFGVAAGTGQNRPVHREASSIHELNSYYLQEFFRSGLSFVETERPWPDRRESNRQGAPRASKDPTVHCRTVTTCGSSPVRGISPHCERSILQDAYFTTNTIERGYLESFCVIAQAEGFGYEITQVGDVTSW
jgi:hypothetical protein